MFNSQDINDQINNLATQVKMFLAGYDYDHSKYLLQTHAERKKTNASICLKQRKCSAEEYREILKLVAPFETQEYLDQYKDWLKSTDIEDNLLSFLEFLAFKKHHRLKTFLKLATEANPKPIYWRYFATGAAITATTAGYFAANHDHFHQTIDWITNQAPKLTIWLMDYVFLPINVPRVSLVIKFFTFAYTLRLILNNHVTDDAHKIKQIIKYFIENALIMVAQFLCYLQGGLLSPLLSMLFIAASLSTTLFSFEEFFNLEKPGIQAPHPTKFLPFLDLNQDEFKQVKEKIIKQDGQLKLLIESIDEKDLAFQYHIFKEIEYQSLLSEIESLSPSITAKIGKAQRIAEFDLHIKQLESQYYYERKKQQLLIEFISLLLITSGSIIAILSLLPLPYLNIFFIVFQFFTNQAKSAYFYTLEQDQAQKMQLAVESAWKTRESVPELGIEHAGVIKAAQKFKNLLHKPDTTDATHESLTPR
jgi:hypothetical protein